jgi:hypothetical protein
MQTMIMNRWKTAAIWLLGGGVTVTGAIVLAASGPGAQDKGKPRTGQPPSASAPKDKAPEPAVDLDSPETLRKQNERRVVAAKQRFDAQRAYYEEGRITIDRFMDASLQLMLAETAASTSKEQAVAAAKAHLDRLTEVQKREEGELTVGRGTVADLAEAVLARENAAVTYLRARQSRGTEEVEALKKRVERLEKQLDAVLKKEKETDASAKQIERSRPDKK